MAVFDEEYYTGVDRYSDGDIENTILSIVEHGVNWKEMSNIPYPVLYHLSEERENILSWYPFRKNCRILEVGSGCGAITGLLCRKAKEVVSVELSKRRGWINYTRNKKYRNLTIRIGNLNDMKFEETFDYVILNGVFEYAASFTEGEHPYETFLNRIKEYCKQDGNILIAIENRLGLKYFAGASEDHTNVHFIGLNEYQGNNTVRTFSKTEMKDLAVRCGLNYADFYYPYPDYKFPEEVYTEKTINEGRYGRPYANLSEDRCFVFDECKMAHTLCREQVMGSFANSFLVDLSQTAHETDHVIYAKMCSGRSEQFRIQTCIYQNEDGERYVEKGPLCTQAIAHVERIKKAESIFFGKKYKILNSKWHEDNLQYSYLKEKTVQKLLTEILQKKDQKLLIQNIEQVLYACIPQGVSGIEYRTDEFCKIFGEFAGIDNEECVNPANIDLIFDNIFALPDGYMVIDPEWWVEFPVPRKFLLWRTLNEFYSSQPMAESIWSRKDCMNHFEISDQQQECYRNWAVYFAEKYVKVSVTNQCAKPVHSMRLDKWMRELRICSSLYLDMGNGFSEKDKIAIEAYCDEGRFELRFDLSNYKGIQAVRWDPVENTGIRCEVECARMEKSGAELKVIPINGQKEDGADLFLTLDPQYSIQQIQQSEWNGTIVILGKLQYLPINQVFAHCLNQQQETKDKLTHDLVIMQKNLDNIQLQLNVAQTELRKTKSELVNVKNTWCWKLYSKIKRTQR